MNDEQLNEAKAEITAAVDRIDTALRAEWHKSLHPRMRKDPILAHHFASELGRLFVQIAKDAEHPQLEMLSEMIAGDIPAMAAALWEAVGDE